MNSICNWALECLGASSATGPNFLLGLFLFLFYKLGNWNLALKMDVPNQKYLTEREAMSGERSKQKEI